VPDWEDEFMSDENKQQRPREINEEKDREQLDPVDLARLERESGVSNKGWGTGQKFNYLIFKIVIFAFVAVAMGMCSIKYIS
jgi:hypothetical protein